MAQVYGGWRERRGFGIGSMTGPQTGSALLAVGVMLGLVVLVPAAAVYLAPAALLAVALFAVRVAGEPLAATFARHAAWAIRRRGGVHRPVSGLPPPLGTVRVLEISGVADVAALWDSERGTVTAIVPVEPTGLALIDPQDADQWVRGWSDWLAHLGYLPSIRHVVVTVDSGPIDRSQGSGFAPQASLTEEVESAESTARTVISLTVDCAGSDIERACSRLLEVLASAAALSRCGVEVLPAMRADEIAAWVRSAYDPASSSPTCAWPDAPPTAVSEQWDHYRHDGFVSAGFTWHECPGQSLPHDVLVRLLAAADYRKRVALVFEPIPAHRAAHEVDRQAQAAAFRRQYRRRLGRDETAREVADLERARQTAREQATGSGLVDVSLYAVVSAGDLADLDSCAADLHNRAGESRIRLRRCYAAQATTFAATLGVGYLPRRR